MVEGTVNLTVKVSMLGPTKDVLRRLAKEVAKSITIRDQGELGVLGEWRAVADGAEVGRFRWGGEAEKGKEGA